MSSVCDRVFKSTIPLFYRRDGIFAAVAKTYENS